MALAINAKGGNLRPEAVARRPGILAESGFRHSRSMTDYKKANDH